MVEVVVGALVRNGRVLLGHRSPDKLAYPDVWDLPGGVIEAGESELSALARELQEELGIEITPAATRHLCRVTAHPSTGPVLLSAWLVDDWQGTPTNLAPDEHVAVGWFGIDELPQLAHAQVRTALLNAVERR